MRAIKESELTYEKLASLLQGSLGFNPVIIENSALYQQVKELTDMAYPSQKNEYDTRWLCFYVPLKFKGKEALIPMDIMEYKGEYFVNFRSSDRLRNLQIKPGEKECNEIYSKVISSAAKFVPKLADLEALEKLVPYDFRTGKIKGKYLMDKDELMSREDARAFLDRYHNHLSKLPSVGKKISLNDYLQTVYVAKKAVLEEVKRMQLLEAYEHGADFRHGGMLDIKNRDSAEEFNQWLESNTWFGSHPFEILSSISNYGISLEPPRAERTDGSLESKCFTLMVGQPAYYKLYLQMLDALMKEGVPVIAPQLEEVLKYLQGETYFKVNVPVGDHIYHGEVSKENFKHIKWDKLEVVKPKGLFDKRV